MSSLPNPQISSASDSHQFQSNQTIVHQSPILTMVNPFICGSGNFHNHQEDEDDEPCSPCSTPRKSRKSRLCKCNRSRDDKNPYANRGLDKFSALVAELEDKRQRLFTQMGSEDISFVRFEYSNSNDCKPIVVKHRGKKQEKINRIVVVDSKKDESMTHNSKASSISPNEVQQPRNESLGDDRKTEKKKMKKRDSENMKVLDLWRPYDYLMAIVILILLLLAVFGKSFAILCTSLGLYFVPNIKGEGSSNAKRPMKRKEYARRVSDKKMISYSLSFPGSV
ncbi:unnamed protein product [Camellia sinensis]